MHFILDDCSVGASMNKYWCIQHLFVYCITLGSPKRLVQYTASVVTRPYLSECLQMFGFMCERVYCMFACRVLQPATLNSQVAYMGSVLSHWDLEGHVEAVWYFWEPPGETVWMGVKREQAGCVRWIRWTALRHLHFLLFSYQLWHWWKIVYLCNCFFRM